jgi:hypothetical protein
MASTKPGAVHVDENGKQAFDVAEQAAEKGVALFNSVKADVSSVLTLYLSEHDDPFVRRVAEDNKWGQTRLNTGALGNGV